MKIVCTVINDLSHDQRMDRICSTLQTAGHEVTLVGRLLPGSPPLPERTYRTERIECTNHQGKTFYLEYNWRLWRTLRKRDFDVLCSVDLDTLVAGRLITRGTSRRWVYDAHEWFSETPEVVTRSVTRAVWKWVGRTLVRLTDVRYTVGHSLAAELAAEYEAPFGVVRNLPFKGDEKQKENIGGVLLYQGMLNPGRGLEVLIEAMGLLPGLECWIVGNGPLVAELKALAVRLGVADRVWFAGFQSPHLLPTYTNKAWLGVNLLEGSSPSYYFSLANKALDYVQAGLPSIQMRFPEYVVINNDYGCYALLDELSPEAVTRAVQQLLDEPASYRRLREGCKRAAADLTWENEAPRLLAIYAGLER